MEHKHDTQVTIFFLLISTSFYWWKNFNHIQSKQNSIMNLYISIIQFQQLSSFYSLSISLANAYHLHYYYCTFTSLGGKFNTLKYTSLHSSSSYFTGLRVVSSIVWNARLSYKNLNNESTYVSHTPMTIIESISHKIPVSLGVTCWLPHHFSEKFHCRLSLRASHKWNYTMCPRLCLTSCLAQCLRCIHVAVCVLVVCSLTFPGSFLGMEITICSRILPLIFIWVVSNLGYCEWSLGRTFLHKSLADNAISTF